MLQKYTDTLHKVKDGSRGWETDKTKCRDLRPYKFAI